jgi:hypothetical protein
VKKIATGAALAAVAVAGLGLASPASATSPAPATIKLEKTTYYGTPEGVEAHKDFTVKGTKVMRHSYITNGIGSNSWTHGSLATGQARKLYNTLDPEALAHEAQSTVIVRCAKEFPSTEWRLQYNGFTVTEQTCGGSLPSFKQHLAEAAAIITDANFTAPPPAEG